MELFDTHCHLDARSFDADREHVIDRAGQQGITRQLIPAINQDNWQDIATLCETPGLYAAYGFHPMYLPERDDRHIHALNAWLDRHSETVAIGECGLDFYIEDFDRDNQQWFLDQQLRVARDRELPVILHARRAVDEILASIRRFAPLTGIVHSYPGSLDQAKRLADLGFKLGIGGPVTYERANKVRGVVRDMPLESLVLETDSPDQPNSHQRGERNEPANMIHVAQTIADIRGESAEQIATVTTRNAMELFKLVS